MKEDNPQLLKKVEKPNGKNLKTNKNLSSDFTKSTGTFTDSL